MVLVPCDEPIGGGAKRAGSATKDRQEKNGEFCNALTPEALKG